MGRAEKVFTSCFIWDKFLFCYPIYNRDAQEDPNIMRTITHRRVRIWDNILGPRQSQVQMKKQMPGHFTQEVIFNFLLSY